MAENTRQGDTGSETKHQEQEEQRIQTEERLSMDSANMADAIDQEEDQKFDSDREARYDDEVEQALSGETSDDESLHDKSDKG